MLQPEEIRALRTAYGFSQHELSELLGFGGATLSRYENGALQDQTHDTILRLMHNPANLLKIVEEDTHVLSAGKRTQLTARLHEEVERAGLIALINRKGQYSGQNRFNGQRELELRRLLNAVKILCYRKYVLKTRLNKLLFYADFKQYQRHGQGITGLCYVRLPSGPAPDPYEVIFQRLTVLDPQLIEEEDPTLECGGATFRCEQEPGESLFSLSELQTLIEADAGFRTFTSSMLVRFSQEEYGYQRTKNGELISYEYAARLRI